MNIAEKLREIIEHVSYREDELPPNPTHKDMPEDAVKCDGLMNDFYLHPVRVKEKEGDIRELLSMMSPKFHSHGEGAGGGASFLELCMDKNGVQWGEHQSCELLIVLGIAIECVAYPLPRDAWSALPGGVPYISIDLGDKSGVHTDQEKKG